MSDTPNRDDLERLARANRDRAIANDPVYAESAMPWDEMTDTERDRAISFWSTVSASHFGRSR